MKEQAHLELTRVSIDFPTDNGPFRALDNVNLKIDEGEFIRRADFFKRDVRGHGRRLPGAEELVRH